MNKESVIQNLAKFFVVGMIIWGATKLVLSATVAATEIENQLRNIIDKAPEGQANVSEEAIKFIGQHVTEIEPYEGGMLLNFRHRGRECDFPFTIKTAHSTRRGELLIIKDPYETVTIEPSGLEFEPKGEVIAN